MKKHLNLVLSIALLFGMVAPSWGQSTTQGKRFWVALPFSNGPSGALELFEPFLAISAQKACDVKISQPAGSWSTSLSVGANSWTVLSNGNPDDQGREATVATPGTPAIPNEVWYNKSWTVSTASEPSTPFPYGLLVEATEEISLYAAMRGVASFDATNVLPEGTLQSEYILQDYPPYNNQNEAHSLFVIVAAEDNTKVDIDLSNPTYKGTTGRIQVTLNKGQSYQVISKDQTTFSGTRVRAYATTDHSAPKPIAVFSGADFTRIPGAKSARDCLYEQAMPLDYWGTEFVVTRSVDKDANRIRITAGDNQAQVFIDGNSRPAVTINAGDTWEFEMSENLATGDMASAISSAGHTAPPVLTGLVHYIKTSCPCAVYSYDVSRQYAASTTTDPVGDPAMVWISPLQQRISKITFGACGTLKCKSCSDKCWTNQHYVNIVCLTTDTASVNLRSEKGEIATPFTVVDGNPTYSYARVFLVDTDESDVAKVFTLSSSNGVIAHVYGSGYNESYAYSVGSATVKQGISVGGYIFTDGSVSKEKFCIGNGPLTFDATVGTDNVTSVNWNFGDGISVSNAAAKMEHEYMNPGWYDVTAELFGAPACTVVSGRQPLLATVNFSFYVARPDTIHRIDTICVDPDYSGGGTTLDTSYIRCDTVVITHNLVLRKSVHTFDTIAHDVAVINGVEYTTSQDGITWTVKNRAGCDSIITCNLQIVKCLDLQIVNDSAAQHACAGDVYNLPFSIDRDGQAGNAWMEKIVYENHYGYQCIDCPHPDYPVATNRYPVTLDVTTDEGGRKSGTIALPIRDWKPGLYTVQIVVEDALCTQPGETPLHSPILNLAIYYPSNIFAFKFNNVLAVYQKGYGGNKGYEFTAYQWYRNGEKIDALQNQTAKTSIYHTEEKFTSGDEYFVLLTDNKYVTLPSCPFTIPDQLDDYNPKKDAPAATKALKNNRMCIVIDDRVYDIFGQRIQ